jgi:hypothetical protein
LSDLTNRNVENSLSPPASGRQIMKNDELITVHHSTFFVPCSIFYRLAFKSSINILTFWRD